MLYHILKVLMTLTLRLYFGRISVTNLKAVDNGQPTLLLANHSNTFMDALLAAIVLRRQIHFFARGDFFGNKVANKLLRSVGMMPIYRISEGKDNLQRNDASNEEAIQILRKGGAVLIFAEGSSSTIKWLRPLKKGPFRLAVIAANELQRPIQIAVLGINYVQPEKPGTDVFIEGGTGPVAMPETDETKASKQRLELLRAASSALETVAWNAGSNERGTLVDALLQRERNISKERASATITRVREAGNEALPGLAQEAMTPVPKPAISTATIAGNVLLILLLGVPALAGWLWHAAPVYAAKGITLGKIKDKDFIAPVRAVLTLVLVLLWYVGAAIALFILLHWYQAVGVLLWAAVSGIIALKVVLPVVQRLRGR